MSETQTTQRIQVTFGVDVPTERIAELQKAMEDLRPGSVQYMQLWDELKAHHQHFLRRLEGECGAYMNIAKEQAKQLYGL